LSDLVILADIAAPSVVVGASLLGFFIYLGVPRGFATILIAHVAFNIAFVVVVVQARVRDLDQSLVEAAQDLGANPFVAFWKVTFPLIFPGVLAGALLAFALSIDDFIITSFVAGQTLTFPLWVYGAVKVGIPPQVFVMGTLIFVTGVALAAVSLIAQRWRPAESV
jgi:spermidine/putrescine transport system permease protein